MRVLMVIATYLPILGGTQRQCALLARELRRRRHEVVVLTRRRPKAPADEVVEGVPVRRTPAFGPGHWQSVTWTLTATAWLRRHGRRFEILQCYQMLSPAHVGILGRSGRQAVVVRPACSGPYGDAAEIQRLPFTRLRRLLLQQADAFVTLTHEIESELKDLGLGAVPCYHLPNAVDGSAFSPATAEERRMLRNLLGLPENRSLCVFVGRLVPQKDPSSLLEAWSLAAKPNAHLVLVGDGPLRPQLEAFAQTEPLRGHVSLVGSRAEVAAYLRAADLLVLPSRAEGMPNVILEAMACALPVLATEVGGAAELLGHGQAGLLVPPGDVPQLANALTRLLQDAGLRWRLGSRARELVRLYSVGRVVDEYLALYEHLVTAGGG